LSFLSLSLFLYFFISIQFFLIEEIGVRERERERERESGRKGRISSHNLANVNIRAKRWIDVFNFRVGRLWALASAEA